MAKNTRIGNLLNNKVNGKTLISIGLGNKGKDPKYNTSVEIIVRDSEGKVVARQTDGFLTLVNPRTEPDDLFAADKISEETRDKMKAGVAKLNDMVKFSVRLQNRE